MNRLCAILSCLLLIWVQAVVMAQPVTAEALVNCGCGCERANCCVNSAPVVPVPLPETSAPSVASAFQLFTLAASTVWSQPTGEAEVFSFASSAPLAAASVPLFTRHCALLI